MTSYADYQPTLYPTTYQDPYGRSWSRSQGVMKDRVVALAADAVDVGLVLRAPDDALPLLGADVALPQLPAEEAADYRLRLAGAWETWPWAGTRHALEVVAEQFDFHGVVLLTAREWGVPDAATRWARWWLVVTLNDQWVSDGAWGDAGTWGDGGTWGSDAPPEVVDTVRRGFRRFSNARDRGHVRFTFGDTDYWGPFSPFAAGVWGSDPAFVEWSV